MYIVRIDTFLHLGEECNDKLDDCKDFVKSKECWNPDFEVQMKENCAKSCGYCSE